MSHRAEKREILRTLSFVDTLKIHGKYTRAIAGCKHRERLPQTSGEGVSREVGVSAAFFQITAANWRYHQLSAKT
jgi:hypothetical protein